MTIKSKMTEKTLNKLKKITGSELTLGKLLWSIRQADEISQVDFSSKLGMSKQQLCDIEHNRKLISPKLASNYAKILGYSEEQFVRLALQGLVDRDGLNIHVDVHSNKSTKRRLNSRAAA